MKEQSTSAYYVKSNLRKSVITNHILTRIMKGKIRYNVVNVKKLSVKKTNWKIISVLFMKDKNDPNLINAQSVVLDFIQIKTCKNTLIQFMMGRPRLRVQYAIKGLHNLQVWKDTF